ncbi:EARLY ENDOSOME ANTIGEN [Salix viminalis]|uniref:EARLY ENDOSOME ANTIGEN n=1 Tax=Salix viminalis TaxID=40686 RepID=A0A9Q0UHP4_SALVM|nr:EARLY ENDOSOME ANTIGEN [Salix viminalis]
MDPLQEIDDYIKETINESLGLPVSARTLQLKLRVYEDAYFRLRDQHLHLIGKFRQKDILIDRAKAEANMNAAAIKKFVEENQRLAAECANLRGGGEREAEERAKEAEIRVRELEEESGKALEELQFYKHKCHARRDDSSAESIDMEENSLESILATLVGKDEVESGRAYLEVNSGYESCQNLLKMWNSLRPSTRKVLSLAAKAKTLQQDKEHLRINLTRAEEEVKLLFEENSILDVENKRLLRREQNFDGSGGKHTSSASAKRSKRKSSSRSSPVESKIDSENIDSLRQPLSPLRHNSPGCRLYKK